MYIPKRYHVTEWNEIEQFVNEHSFGIIVTTGEGKPMATHVPLVLRKLEEDYYLSTHLAIGNPQWKSIEKEPNQEVLVIFQGPHTYITSSWYERENVPTWNYQAVHMYGKASILNEQELEEDLAILLRKYEGHRDNPVLWETMSDQTKRMKHGIVGIKVKVEEVQAAYKLSQNRNERDYDTITHKLQLQKDENSQKIAEEMIRIKKN